MKVVAEESREQLHDAAVKVQRLFRGNLARKRSKASTRLTRRWSSAAPSIRGDAPERRPSPDRSGAAERPITGRPTKKWSFIAYPRCAQARKPRSTSFVESREPTASLKPVAVSKSPSGEASVHALNSTRLLTVGSLLRVNGTAAPVRRGKSRREE